MSEDEREPATTPSASAAPEANAADTGAHQPPAAPAPRKNTRRAPRQSERADPPARTSTHPRRNSSGSRERESGVRGLGERARLTERQSALNFLPDPLAIALPAMRQTLLNRPLDDGLRAVVEGLAAALAPATAQVWITDPAPWVGDAPRAGGRQLSPAPRLRAEARVGTRPQHDTLTNSAPNPAPSPAISSTRWSNSGDPLIAEVATARRAIILTDPHEHSLAAAWRTALSAAQGDEPPALATLAALPLTARGRLLGVVALGTALHLNARQQSALAELAELLALAADRDQLLSYSRGQEALAQTVVRHAPVAIAVLTGPEHTFALTNPTFALLLGIESEADLAGRRLREILPEGAQSFITSLRLSAVLEAGEPQAMIELPIHLARGLTYWNVTTTPLPTLGGGGGVLIAAVEVTRLVLAKQRAQEAAEIAQERIGQMMTLHATSLAVASQLGADPRELLADILRRSILLLNARAGTVYVRDPRREELRVIVCQGLRGEYTGNRIRVGEGLAGQVALSGKGLIVDDYRAYPYRAAIYDNEAFSAVIAVPLVHHGQVVGVLDVLDDAERRTFTDDDLWLLDLFASQAAQAIENARTYVELEHAYRKQRELDRLKDDFIATASHELRTPLTGVQGFLDLLLEFPGSRDDALALDFLQKAADSAQELANISERLLQTSRLDTGRLDPHLSPVRLAPVAEEVVRVHRELRQARGTAHELAVDVPRDVYVEVDLGRLKEVLDNLVGNAVKYSPHGGRITIRCVPATLGEPEPRYEAAAAAPASGPNPHGAVEDRPTIVLTPAERDGLAGDAEDGADATNPAPSVVAAASIRKYYVLLVTDEGMGIAAEERSRLFGRFSRTESARASQIRGTGLGLYICRQIVRAMGGDVWLRESVPGRGSTFAVALPSASVAEPTLLAPARPAGHEE